MRALYLLQYSIVRVLKLNEHLEGSCITPLGFVELSKGKLPRYSNPLILRFGYDSSLQEIEVLEVEFGAVGFIVHTETDCLL
jgi:hypothetical protein